jgi:hypothetical protein
MKEGWAEFVATRTWYPDSKSTSQPIYSTYIHQYEVEPGGYTFPQGYFPGSDSCGGYKCVLMTCDCYSRNEIMALRAFWDTWDTNVDGYDDANTEVSWQNMALIWSLYPSGTGNACRSEYNTNMRDYQWNAMQISADAFWDVGRVHQQGQTDMVCQPWP